MHSMHSYSGDTTAGQRILIVDDDEQICRLLARALQRKGYACEIAGTARDAQQSFAPGAAEPFALALLDIQLPDQSGLVLAHQLLEMHPDTVVIMVTGIDEISMADTAFDLGAYGYLVKPFSTNEIMISVISALRRRQLELQHAESLRAERNANARLVELNTLKTEFISMVSHDLRSPLAGVRMLAEVCCESWMALPDERKLNALECIGRTVTDLSALVSDVLDVSRIESGDVHYEIVEMNIAQLAGQVIEDVKQLWPEREWKLVTDNRESLVMADKVRNRQILTNLLVNAVKYSSDTTSIEVDIRRTNGDVAIAVRDYGIGIDAEVLPNIFERFWTQTPSSMPADDQSGGIGLGLFICRSMVEGQGGSISVESTLGRGSTFTFTLPAVPAVAY